MKKYAFFDLDYTLIGHDTITLFADFMIRRNPLRILYLFLVVPLSVPVLLKLASPGILKRAFFSLLWGLRKNEAEALFQEFTDSCVIPEIFPEMIQEIERCRKEGYTLILNSASADAYTDIIAARLGFDISIGTSLRMDPVMPLLPVIEGPNNKHAVKILKMMKHLPPEIQSAWSHYTYEMASQKIPWPVKSIPGARAYSDSMADLPMLELAEDVYTVNPSASLRKTAEKRGWKILNPALPYRSVFHKYYLIIRQLLGLYAR